MTHEGRLRSAMGKEQKEHRVQKHDIGLQDPVLTHTSLVLLDGLLETT